MEVAYRPAVCRDNDVVCEHEPNKVELGETTSSYRVSEPPRRLCAAREESREERVLTGTSAICSYGVSPLKPSIARSWMGRQVRGVASH